jgi:hypothetical protein
MVMKRTNIIKQSIHEILSRLATGCMGIKNEKSKDLVKVILVIYVVKFKLVALCLYVVRYVVIDTDIDTA